MKIYRQGDVLLVEVVKVPASRKKRVQPSKRGFVLAEGEVTGHAHVLAPDHVKMWSVGDQRYIVVARESTLTHEEHAPIAVPPGAYRVIQQREYSPEEIRRVAD